MPSATLLGQSVVSGLLVGGLYGLLALGLSLSWGLLRLVNIAHFALALLGAYLTYQLGQVLHMAPWVAAAVVVPAFFARGVALHVRRQGAARIGGGSGDRRGLRREPSTPRVSPLGCRRRLRRRRRRVHRAHLDAGADADLDVARGRLRGRDHRRSGQSGRGPARRIPHRRQRIGDDGGRGARVGASRLVFDPDPRAGLATGTGMSERRRFVVGLAAATLALGVLPLVGLPAFYESFLYLVFHWMALATSWSLLSGYAGYFSFGHGAFFGAGMYTTTTLAVTFGLPFLATLPIAGLVAA